MNRRIFLAGMISSPALTALPGLRAEVSVAEKVSPDMPCEHGPLRPNCHLAMKVNTTGFTPEYGHHIYEIAITKIVGECTTGQCFHQYFRAPQSDQPGLRSYGAPPWFLRENISFGQVAPAIVALFAGADIVTHNARLELAFLDHDLRAAGLGPVEAYCASITDIAVMGRRLFGVSTRSGTLDEFCRRLSIDAPDSRVYHFGVDYALTVARIYARMNPAIASKE